MNRFLPVLFSPGLNRDKDTVWNISENHFSFSFVYLKRCPQNCLNLLLTVLKAITNCDSILYDNYYEIPRMLLVYAWKDSFVLWGKNLESSVHPINSRYKIIEHKGKKFKFKIFLLGVSWNSPGGICFWSSGYPEFLDF